MSTLQLEKAREAWDDIAAGYDQFVAPTEIWLANEALQRAGLRYPVSASSTSQPAPAD